MQPVFFPVHCTGSIYTFHQVHCNPATDETSPLSQIFTLHGVQLFLYCLRRFCLFLSRFCGNRNTDAQSGLPWFSQADWNLFLPAVNSAHSNTGFWKSQASLHWWENVASLFLAIVFSFCLLWLPAFWNFQWLFFTPKCKLYCILSTHWHLKGRWLMPLVRIDMIKGKSTEYKKQVLECVHAGLKERHLKSSLKNWRKSLE